MLMLDELIGHLRESIVIPDPSSLEIIDRKKPGPEEKDRPPYYVPEGEYVPVMPSFGEGKRYNITGLIHDDSGFPTNSHSVARKLVTRLMEKVDKNLDDIIEYEELYTDDAEIAVFCYGGTARGVFTAVEQAREAGIKAGVFRAITIWPFPRQAVLELSKKVSHILVAEHNYGQLVLEVERVVKNNCGISHIGKVDGTVITPDEILSRVEGIAHGELQ